MTFRKGRWSVSARGAVAAVVLGSASTLHAGTIQWVQTPIEGDPTPASYDDALNWSDNFGFPGAPGANDVALFDAADVFIPTVALPSSVSHVQMKVLNSWPTLIASTYNASNPTRLTLTRADNFALQVGAATSTYAGSAYLSLYDLHLDLPNGGLTVSGADGELVNGAAYLDADRASMTVKKDFVLGANAGSAAAYMTGNATARIGGDILIGAVGGSIGQLELYDGYKIEVGGNLKLGDGYIGTNGPTVAPQTTGITVAGDVHVGPHANPAGDGGTIVLDYGSYLHAGGDVILHAAPDIYTASFIWVSTDSRASAQNLVLENEAVVEVSDGGRFDVRGNVTVQSRAFLGVWDDSVMTVGGTVSVEPGGEVAVTGTLTAGLTNRGTMRLTGPAGHATAYAQAADGQILVSIASTADFGHLTVDQVATLDGLLTLDFDAGYVPTEGATFDILDAAQTLGTFGQVRVDAPGWYAAFNPATGVVTLSQTQAVPEPTALLAALPIALLRRRRRASR